MKLFKSCKPEHNIAKECKSLKLGTLYGYRREEDEDIRDEGEGTYHLELEFLEKITISKQTANILLHPIFSFGEFEPLQFSGDLHCVGSKIQVQSQADDTVHIQAEKISINRQVADRFVFCMSISDSKPPLISDEYSDHWAIDNNEAEEFSRGIAKGLLASTIRKPSIVQGLSKNNLKTLEVIYKHQKVSYLPRTHKLSKVNQESVDSYIRALTHMDFVKPEKYAPNLEYRFTFEVHSESGVHLPTSDSAFIDSFFVKDLANHPTV